MTAQGSGFAVTSCGGGSGEEGNGWRRKGSGGDGWKRKRDKGMEAAREGIVFLTDEDVGWPEMGEWSILTSGLETEEDRQLRL